VVGPCTELHFKLSIILEARKRRIWLLERGECEAFALSGVLPVSLNRRERPPLPSRR
jgi:hypothetical protein